MRSQNNSFRILERNVQGDSWREIAIVDVYSVQGYVVLCGRSSARSFVLFPSVLFLFIRLRIMV